MVKTKKEVHGICSGRWREDTNTLAEVVHNTTIRVYETQHDNTRGVGRVIAAADGGDVLSIVFVGLP